MKPLFTLMFAFITLQTAAQKQIATTESFLVTGEVKEPKTFSINDFSGLPIKEKDSLVITNHLLEKRSTLKNIQGVLLKDILSKVTVSQDNPKLLSEYYIVCEATDNYKVVFSWNEIFNNPLGESVILITGVNAKTGNDVNGHIALITLSDIATGRRYVKGLKQITIKRTQ